MLEAFGSIVGRAVFSQPGWASVTTALRLLLAFGFRQPFQFFGFLRAEDLLRFPHHAGDVPVLVGELVEDRFQFAVEAVDVARHGDRLFAADAQRLVGGAAAAPGEEDRREDGAEEQGDAQARAGVPHAARR